MVLPRARGVEEGLARIRAAGIEPVPNLWQVTLGVYRMWWRLLTRSETIGTSEDPVRSTTRARLLYFRPFRFPFLLREQAVNPADFSGLASPPERIVRHLLGAHHDRNQFVYDLQLLSCFPGVLDDLLERAQRVVSGEDPRAEWLRDLVVHEGYHERLVDTIQRFKAGDDGLTEDEAADPDISFDAYLRWCASQPATPRETLTAIREGRISFAPYEAHA
jgi:hypothetical protein